MGLEVIDPAFDDGGGVEDGVAPMDHVVVEREDHEGGIGDDTPKLARIEGRVLHRLPAPKGPELVDHGLGRQGA